MSTRRLKYANNLASGAPVARGVPGNTAALGAATFTRADATTCATQNSAAGIISTVAANILRDSHFTAGYRVILLEASIANQTRDSNGFSAARWSKNGCTATQDITGPDNVASSAWTVTATSAVTANLQNTNPGGAPNIGIGETYFVGVVVNIASTSPYLLIDEAGDGVTHRGWFKLSDMTVGTQTGVTCFIERLGTSNWYVCWIKAVATNLHGVSAFLKFAGTDNSQTPVNGSTLLLYNNDQIINNPYLGSQVVTTSGAIITRAVDALSYAGVPITGTLFYHYYDYATRAWTSAVAAYTANTAIVPPTGRGYYTIAVLGGTLTAAQCKTILGGTFPS